MLRRGEWKQYMRAGCGTPWAAFWGSLVRFLALLHPSPVTLGNVSKSAQPQFHTGVKGGIILYAACTE